MKLVVASALFPPDVAPPAPFLKTLVTRLAPSHEVTAVVYGKLPEEVPGVTFVPIDKEVGRFKRLVEFTRALVRAARDADIVFAENGPSTELPVILTSLLTRTPVLLHRGDTLAISVAGPFARVLQWVAEHRSKHVFTESPKERPEILPFAERPEQALKDYDASWNTFMQNLEQTLSHVTR